MRRAGLLVVPVILLTPVAAQALTRYAPTATVAESVTLGTESWYDLSSTCVTTGVCISPNMGYPAGTLHVSVSAGALSTLTALEVPATAVPQGATVTGGMLKVPLDTLTPGNGSAAPELSQVEICPTTEPITANAGGTAPAPTGNCSVKAPAVIVGTPATELDFDLAPIAAALSTPGTNLVLTAADVGTQSDSWHVVFSSNARTSPPTAPPTLSLTYLPAGSQTQTQPLSDGGISGALGAPPAAAKPTKKHPTSTSAPATQPAAVPVPAAVIPAPAADTDGTAGVPVAAPTVAAAPTSAPAVGTSTSAGGGASADAPVTLGGRGNLAADERRIYDYPEVFFLPFLLGFFIYALGRQLTRPVPRMET